MDTWVIIAIAIVAAAVLGLVAAYALWAYLRNRRTTELRDTFGPEYDRVVKEQGRSAGEK
jgi:protein-S-isoprenylcysteine O-methyltransferase Ste14